MKILAKYVGHHMVKGDYEITEEHAKELVGNKDWVLPVVKKETK